MENLAQAAGDYSAMMVEFADLGIQYALNLLTAIAILIAGFIIAGWVGRLIRRRLDGIEKFDRALIPVVTQIARYAILTLTFVLVLSEFGVQTASIIAVLGAAGLAIGLALQGTLQNVAAGFMLLFIRPFTIGDFVDAGSCSGTVDEIGLFTTQLRTPQGIYVSVPNSTIWSDPIINYSKLPNRRIDVTFGISYDDDIEKARELIVSLAKGEDRVLTEPAPMVNVVNLGDSSVDLELRAWTPRQEYWDVRWGLIREGKKALDKAGISIPYPHVQMVQDAPAK